MERCPFMKTTQADDESQDFCELTEKVCELVSGSECPKND